MTFYDSILLRLLLWRQLLWIGIWVLTILWRLTTLATIFFWLRLTALAAGVWAALSFHLGLATWTCRVLASLSSNWLLTTLPLAYLHSTSLPCTSLALASLTLASFQCTSLNCTTLPLAYLPCTTLTLASLTCASCWLTTSCCLSGCKLIWTRRRLQKNDFVIWCNLSRLRCWRNT